jgi:hypothetical protein
MGINEHGVAFIAVIPGERWTVYDWNIEIWSKPRTYTKKFRWSNARNREGNVIDAYGLADGCRVPCKPLTPIVIAENRYLRRSRAIVIVVDQPTYSRNDSKTVKKIAGNKFHGLYFGLATNDYIELPSTFVGK